MKSFLITLALLGVSLFSYSQNVYQIRADSVRIYNTCDTAELILENRTQNVPGFLYNKGRGRTEFRRLQFSNLGSGLIAIPGQDTLDLSSSLSNIYNADGILTGNRILTGENHYALKFDSLSLFDVNSYIVDGGQANRVINNFHIEPTETDMNSYAYNYQFTNPAFATFRLAGNVPQISLQSGFANSSGGPQQAMHITPSDFHLWFGLQSNNYIRDTAISIKSDVKRMFIGTSRMMPASNVVVGNRLYLSSDLNDDYAFRLEKDSVNRLAAANFYRFPLMSVRNNGVLNLLKYKNNATEDSVLTTDVNGNLKLKLMGGGGGGADAFYTADGTLSDDRTVEGDSHTLTFNNGAGFFASGTYLGQQYAIGTYERPLQNAGVRLTYGANEMQLGQSYIRFANGGYQMTIQPYGTETTKALVNNLKVGFPSGAWYNTAPVVPLDVYLQPFSGLAAAVRIVDGNEGAGKVLTSDANGYATWQTPAAGASAFSAPAQPQITTVSGNTTLTESNYTVLANNASNVTVSLPPAAANTGRIYFIKKISNNSNTVTVAPAAGETIDGASNYSISAYNRSIQVQSNGSAWYILTVM